MKWRAADVIDRLRVAYGLDGELGMEEWSLLTEVPLRTPKIDPYSGKTREGYFGSNQRSIDVLLVRNWSSGRHGHERMAVEVKVSRSDYRNETDAKREPAEHAAHRTVYAAPAGIIDPTTLPDDWGLIEVYEDAAAAAKGTGAPVGAHDSPCLWRRLANRRTPDCDMDYLAAALARKGSRYGERLRRGETAADRVPTLEAEVNRLAGMLQRREIALDRERKRANEARSLLLAIEGAQTCADCGTAVTLRRGGHALAWTHTAEISDSACYEIRRKKAQAAQEARTGARYLAGWAGPVEPAALRQAYEDEEAG